MPRPKSVRGSSPPEYVDLRGKRYYIVSGKPLGHNAALANKRQWRDQGWNTICKTFDGENYYLYTTLEHRLGD